MNSPKATLSTSEYHRVPVPVRRPGGDALQGALTNHLLAALPHAEFERMAPHLEWVAMPQGEVLFESGVLRDHVYFPETAVVSLHYLTQNGGCAEVAEIGREGMVGISLLLGINATPNRSSVVLGGYGYRLEARILMQELRRSGGRRGGALQHLLMRNLQQFIVQVSQTAVCNRLHSVEQQLCRWLLQACDRVPSQTLTVTHELIGRMLGVRREGVTAAVGVLQAAGMLHCERGHITVVDRDALEQRACECYAVVKSEMARLHCADMAMPGGVANQPHWGL